MAGRLVAGWEKAAVAHASCRRTLSHRRVVLRCAQRVPQSKLSLGSRFSTCRRDIWRISAAEEVAEEAPKETEDAPKEEASDTVVEETSDETKGSEHTDLVDAAAAEALTALEDGSLKADDLNSAFGQIKDLVANLSSSLATAEARASLSAEEENERQNQYLRLKADFENFRKRSATERAQLKESATSDIILQLLPIIDNFELARGQVSPATEGEEKINNSYQGLYKQMVDTFKTLGVEPIVAKGQPFDPEVHEAIMREPNDDVPDGTVLDEFRRGFMLKGNLMRAAMVKVSHSDEGSSPSPAPEGNGESEENDAPSDGGEGNLDTASEEESAPKPGWKEVSTE
ncbi:hypothetical protein BSKO_08001 [Bryopsis sp. KO-2023]|nr:hypothetical protein BSKO_08001 [Bryopsis sp. KO-2023]